MTERSRESAAAAPLVSLIPAAGRGLRMQAARPKQYLPIAGRTMLERTIDALGRVPDVERIEVVLDPEDRDFDACCAGIDDPRVRVRRCGGSLRAETVLAGARHVVHELGDDARVLVHDAARPLVAPEDVRRLIETVERERAIGGLLATPLQSTLKRAGHVADLDGVSHAIRTEPRAGLWLAETPQLFRAGALVEALRAALDGPDAASITDEAAAFERLGELPLLVPSRHPNLKITWPQDLAVAEALLAAAVPLDGEATCA